MIGRALWIPLVALGFASPALAGGGFSFSIGVGDSCHSRYYRHAPLVVRPRYCPPKPVHYYGGGVSFYGGKHYGCSCYEPRTTYSRRVVTVRPRHYRVGRHYGYGRDCYPRRSHYRNAYRYHRGYTDRYFGRPQININRVIIDD